MPHLTELNFFRKVLDKMRIQTTLIYSAELPNDPLDFGLRKFLGREEEYHNALHNTLHDPLLKIEGNTVYKITDSYFCNYIFFLLADHMSPDAVLIGPYLTDVPSHQQILEMAELFSIPPAKTTQLEDYYVNLPVMSDPSPLFSIINTLAECLWGEGSAYDIKDLNQDMFSGPIIPRSGLPADTKEDTLLQMKIMEARYAYEKELMENVEKGLAQRAEHMVHLATQEFMTQRISDPLRSLKNYCIICNTLMRKAAENGGVHPIHLNRLSSSFATKIEAASQLRAAQALIPEMVHAYCRTVRRLSTKQYSPLIQKVVSHIEADLAGELSLHTLSAAHCIHPSYLSSLFRKETGKTLTEYINQRRMDLGAQLLKTTNLQVQTIAQHCGLSDTNYFSKLFKKHFGMTPRQYRDARFSSQTGR